MEYPLRFAIGGLVVSLFAIIGDVLRPKSFAGLFGAAPSVALATLGLTFIKHGADYAAAETRSMMIGATALAVYSVIVCQLLVRLKYSAIVATSAALAGWLAVAVGIEQLLIG
jgi:hypothetical protein